MHFMKKRNPLTLVAVGLILVLVCTVCSSGGLVFWQQSTKATAEFSLLVDCRVNEADRADLLGESVDPGPLCEAYIQHIQANHSDIHQRCFWETPLDRDDADDCVRQGSLSVDDYRALARPQ